MWQKTFLAVLFIGMGANASYAQNANLQRAIELLGTSPSIALEQLANLPMPAAKAFQAYGLFVQYGPSAQIDKLMHRAIAGVSDTYALGDIELGKKYQYSSLQLLLNHLRFVAGAEPIEDIIIPCFIFQRHPQEAYKSFDSYGGYNHDNLPRLCALKTLPKLKELIDYVHRYRKFYKQTQGYLADSYRRRQELYLIKAYQSPQLSLNEVDFPIYKTTLAQARKAMPQAQWIDGVEKRLQNATQEAVETLSAQYPMVPLKTLKKNIREALEAAVSYQLIKGEVVNFK